MANLTLNSPRRFRGAVKYGRQPVAANVEVFAGSAMEAHSGGVDMVDGGASSDFVGFAAEYVDNRTNSVPHGGAAGAASVKLATMGEVFLSVNNGGEGEDAPFVFSDVGKVVYGTDGNAFDTVTTTGTKIGKIVDLLDAVSNGSNTETVVVRFDAGLSSLLIV